MTPPRLYPLQFEPICQYRLWGGRRLGEWLSVPLPGDGPIGEAWILSDRADHSTLIANGPFKGRTLGQLLDDFPEEIMGALAYPFRRFPLLLKFLDVHQMLSVQVHPSDRNAAYIPPGESGKTEAWVVLEAGSESRIYAGLKPGVTEATLRQALADGTTADQLPCFNPKPGDGVLLPAGAVHSLGGDIVVFEVQQNSDVTFRLYDWDHIDAKTGQRRPLQVDQAMACIDFAQGSIIPSMPVVEEKEPTLRERLFFCEHFGVWRIFGETPFTVGVTATPRVVVCLSGTGRLECDGVHYPIRKGNVLLLPAVVGACLCQPHGVVSLLEISLPNGSSAKR